MGDIRKWCPMCGAAPGDPCRVISGEDDFKPGDERPDVHWARNNDERPQVLIPDEPEIQQAASEEETQP